MLFTCYLQCSYAFLFWGSECLYLPTRSAKNLAPFHLHTTFRQITRKPVFWYTEHLLSFTRQNEVSPADEKPSRWPQTGCKIPVYSIRNKLPPWLPWKKDDWSISLQLKNRIIKYLQKRTVQNIKTGQPYVYEMLLTLFWLLKNPSRFPPSVQDVQGFRQSIVTPTLPFPRVPLSPSKEGAGLEEHSITFLTVISFHQGDTLALKGGPQPHLICSSLYSEHTGKLTCG